MPSGFAMPLHLFDLTFESQRSALLSVWNLSMFFLTVVLMMGPASYGHDLATISCEAAVGFTPSFRPYYYLPGETVGTSWVAPLGGYFDIPGRALSGVGLDSHETLNAPMNNVNFDSSTAHLKTVREAAAACSAACASDDPIAVARALMMSNTKIWSSNLTVDQEPISQEYLFNSKWGTCGYFRSQYTVRSDTVKTVATLNTNYRPLLVAALNNRANRAFGWAGLAWIAALAVDIYVLADRAAHDLKFCNVAQGSVPQGFYDRDALKESENALGQPIIHPLSVDGLDETIQDTGAIPDTFTCNVSAKMMQRLKKMAQRNSTRLLDRAGDPPWQDAESFLAVGPDESDMACMSVVVPDSFPWDFFHSMPERDIDYGGSAMASPDLSGDMRGGSAVEGVESCWDLRAGMYVDLATEESRQAWALRVARFAEETNTTVGALEAQEETVHRDNSLRDENVQSILETFRYGTWRKEIMHMFQVRFENMEPAAVSRKVPLLFYDETKWIGDQVTARQIMNWITLATPIRVFTETQPHSNPLGHVGAGLANVFVSILFKPILGVDVLQNFARGGSWKDASRVGTPATLMKRAFNERAYFASVIGRTWALIQWLRFWGLIVEICLLVYVATKYLLRRFANKPDARCSCLYRAKLYLDRSPKERLLIAKKTCCFSFIRRRSLEASGGVEILSPLHSDRREDVAAGQDKERQSLPRSPARDNKISDDGIHSNSSNRSNHNNRTTTTLSAYAAMKAAGRMQYRVPSRVWAAVVASMIMTVMSSAWMFSWWLWIGQGGQAGLGALNSLQNDPSGSAVRLVRQYLVPTFTSELKTSGMQARVERTADKWVRGIEEATVEAALDSVTAFGNGSFLVNIDFEFSAQKTNISNLTMPLGSAEILRVKIAQCISERLHLDDVLRSKVEMDGQAIANEMSRFVEDLFVQPVNFATELIHLRDKSSDILDDISNFSNHVLANPEICTVAIEHSVSSCLNASIASFAAMVPAALEFTINGSSVTNVSVDGLSKREAEQLRGYAQLVEKRMQSAVSTFLEQGLPSLVCNASAAIAGNVSSTLWAAKLGLDSLLQLGVNAALKSEQVQSALKSIPGINGTAYVEYFLTMDTTANRERLFGLGDKLVRAMVKTQLSEPYLDPETNLMTDCPIACSPVFITTNTIFLVMFITGICTCIFCVLAVVAVWAQMRSFLQVLRETGQRQLDTVHAHFDARTGYKTALLRGEMTLEDVCSVIGRSPTVEEYRTLGVRMRASERTPPHVVAALAKMLEYETSLMRGADFIGSYTFLNVCAFWIYHVFMVTAGTIVGVYPAWLALLSAPQIWLPLTMSIVLKKLLACCIAGRVLSRKGDDDDVAGHRGIRFLQGFSVFEALYTGLSAILGWATASMRILASLGWTILMFPRVDVVLTGGGATALDSAHQTLLGVMAATRLRAEFAATVLAQGEDVHDLGGMGGDEGEQVKVPNGLLVSSAAEMGEVENAGASFVQMEIPTTSIQMSETPESKASRAARRVLVTGKRKLGSPDKNNKLTTRSR